MNIPQMEPWFDELEKKAVVDYLDGGGWLTEHAKTRDLEKMIADYTGSKYCCMVCNGTIALVASLLACEVKDDVIVPDYTMIASATAVHLIGQYARPVDVERETFCIDVNKITKLKKYKMIMLGIKAVMLVSINGRYPKGVEEIIEFCRDRNIRVIEDAAQSLGSFYKGKHVGTMGDVGCFSFSTPKIISTGQGGAIVTDDKEIYEKVKLLKNFGREKGGVDKSECIGYNFKFTDLQAVIGIEQMKKLPWRVHRKRAMYQLYREELENVKGLHFVLTRGETTPWMIDVLVDKRKKLMEFLKDKNIGTRPFYPSIHMQKPYYPGFGNYPNSRYISKHGLWLPSSSKLTDEEIIHVCDMIKSEASG